jgi:hypothetical protein
MVSVENSIDMFTVPPSAASAAAKSVELVVGLFTNPVTCALGTSTLKNAALIQARRGDVPVDDSIFDLFYTLSAESSKMGPKKSSSEKIVGGLRFWQLSK